MPKNISLYIYQKKSFFNDQGAFTNCCSGLLMRGSNSYNSELLPSEFQALLLIHYGLGGVKFVSGALYISLKSLNSFWVNIC